MLKLLELAVHVRAYIKSKDGATAIEYGLIAGGISLAIVAAVFAFGDDLNTVFSTISARMSSVAARAS